VSELEIVSPAGEIMTLGRRTKKSSAGYRQK
jgi:FAD/FMN-containing dehydrogenase